MGSYTDNSTILGGAGNDTLYGDITHAIVDGGAGNDLLQIVDGFYADDGFDEENLLIKGGAGNDVIETQAYSVVYKSDTSDYEDIYSSKMTINGGAGNDTIRNTFINKPTNETIKYTDGNSQVTIRSYLDSKTGKYFEVTTTKDSSGTNSSTITSSLFYDRTFQYTVGDGPDAGIGNDLIEDYHEGEVIQLMTSDTTIDSVNVSGKNLVLKIGSGSITLKDASAKSVTILNSYGTTSKLVKSGSSFVNVIDYDGWDNVSLIGMSMKDSVNNNNWDMGTALISTGAGDDVINNNGRMSGVIIPGAGNDTINLNSSGTVLYASGDGNDVITGESIKDPTLALAKGTSVTSYTVSGNDHIFNIGSGKVTFKDVDASLYRDNVPKFIIPNYSTVKSSDGGIDYNYTYNKAYIGGKVFNINGSVDEYGYFTYNNTGTANADYIIHDVGDTSVVNGAAGDDYIELFYDEIVSYSSSVSASGGDGNDTIFAQNISKSTIDGGDGNDLLQVIGGESSDDMDGANILVNGGAGADVIEIQQTYDNDDQYVGKAVTINAGAGNDTIRNAFINNLGSFTKVYNNDMGGTSTVKASFDAKTNSYITVTTHKDSDGYSETSTVKSAMIYDRTFVYASGDGDDLIEDYADGETIKITDGTIDTVSISGNNVVIKVGSGSGADSGQITLKNAKNKRVTITDAEGTTTSKVYGTGTSTGIITNDIDNAVVSGTAGNDSIVSSNTATINGGAGNDQINIDGAYNAVIEYKNGDGKDTVTSYSLDNEDIIRVTDSSTIKGSIKDNDVILSVGNTAVTLKDVKKSDADSDLTSTVIKIMDADGNTGNFELIGTQLINKSGSTTNYDDFINNDSSSVTLNGGAGNDTIINSAYTSDVSISGGAGNDSIVNSGGGTINGGSGNDTIDFTVSTEYGMIYAGGGVIQYANGDGSDADCGKDVINYNVNEFYSSSNTPDFGTIELARPDAGSDLTTISKYAIKGSTHTLTIGKGSVVINNLNNDTHVKVRTLKNDGSYSYTRLYESRQLRD